MRDVAVIDRFIDGERAVLLVGDPPGREVRAPADALPPGASEGDWLRVELEGDRLVAAAPDPDATARARSRVRAKRAGLRKRGRKLE